MENSSETIAKRFDVYLHRPIGFDTIVAIYRTFLDLYTFGAVLCVAADVFIVFCALRYRRLRKERCNLVLLHWCFGNIAFMISSSVLYWLLYYRVLKSVGYCVVEHFEEVSLLYSTLLMLVVTVYWFLKLHAPDEFEKFSRRISYYVAAVYCASALYSALSAYSCYPSSWLVTYPIMISVCAVYALASLILDAAHLRRRRGIDARQRARADSPFVLSHVYCASFYVALLAVLILHYRRTNDDVLFATAHALKVIVMLTPLYFMAALYKYDDDFGAFFEHVLSCRCRSYGGDELGDDRPVAFTSEGLQVTC